VSYRQRERMRLKRIHVNQHVIRRNSRTSTQDPPLTIKTSLGNVRAYRVVIEGPSEVVYRPDKPLPCGARVWVETRAPLTVQTLDAVHTLT
jgi:hypothetical protein